MTDYKIKSIKEVASPSDIFPLVMKYAKQTGENPWLCWYDIMRYSTVVVYEEEVPVAYTTGYRNENGDLFIDTALAEHQLTPDIFDDICRLIKEEQGTSSHIFISSVLPARLLTRYGFTYFETTYKKTLDPGGD